MTTTIAESPIKLRNNLDPNHIDICLAWVLNPEGPSSVNPSGGVWVLTGYPTREGAPVLDEQLFRIQPGEPPADFTVSPTGEDWWTLADAPLWVRSWAVGVLRERTVEEERQLAWMRKFGSD